MRKSPKLLNVDSSLEIKLKIYFSKAIAEEEK